MQSVEEVAQQVNPLFGIYVPLTVTVGSCTSACCCETSKQNISSFLMSMLLPMMPRRNVSTWMNAKYIRDVVKDIIDVRPHFTDLAIGRCADASDQIPGKRLTDTFRKTNASSGPKYVPGGRLPPRRTSASATFGAPPTPSSPIDHSRHTTPPAPGSPPSASTSPSRRVVSDFKPFGAASFGSDTKPLSVFGAPLLPTGPGGGMFGSAGRTPAMNGGRTNFRGAKDDDEEDEDDGPAFKRDAISLDQVS